MAVKGACWVKNVFWNSSGTGCNIMLGLVSIDANTQVENDLMMTDANPTLSRATIIAAARDELINTYGIDIQVLDTVVLLPSVI